MPAAVGQQMRPGVPEGLLAALHVGSTAELRDRGEHLHLGLRGPEC